MPSEHQKRSPTAVIPAFPSGSWEHLYPPQLKLVHVSFFHRHGERTPIRNYIPSFVPDQAWTLCHVHSAFNATLACHQQEVETNRLSVEQKHIHNPPPFSHTPVHPAMESPPITEKQPNSATVVVDSSQTMKAKFISSENLKSVGPVQRCVDYGINDEQPWTQPNYIRPLPGQCAYGQLTDKGRETLFRIGLGLRDLYVHKLRFLPQLMSQENTGSLFYFRTTDYPRTLESLQHFIGGLYPVEFRNHAAPPLVHTRMAHEETLIGSGQCKRYRQLLREFKHQYRQLNEEHIEQMRRKHNALLKDPQVKPNLHALYDTFIAQYAHGMPLPSTGVTDNDIFELEDHAFNLWFAALSKSKQTARLAIGRFMGEWKQMLEQVISRKGDYAQLKLSVFSGHDSTIAPVLGVFRISDGKWPPFAANIAVEVFEEQQANEKEKEHYVRFKYNNTIVNVPECEKPGNGHPRLKGYCTWKAFMNIVDEHTPEDYEAECQK